MWFDRNSDVTTTMAISPPLPPGISCGVDVEFGKSYCFPECARTEYKTNGFVCYFYEATALGSFGRRAKPPTSTQC